MKQGVNMTRDNLQYQMALRLLKEAKDGPFYAALKSEFQTEFDVKPGNIDPVSIATHYANPLTHTVKALFKVVRRALLSVSKENENAGLTQKVKETATALYFLAACRLIYIAQSEAIQAARTATPHERYVLRTPSDEIVMYAINVAARHGGALHWVFGENGELSPQHFFVVQPSENGDRTDREVENAAYIAVMSNRGETAISLGGVDLTPQKMQDLKTRFEVIASDEYATPALVFPSGTKAESMRAFVETFLVPVVIPENPENDDATEWLGMKPIEIKSLIGELSRRLDAQPSTQGAAPMSQRPVVTVNVSGNVSNLGVGDHHQQQSGSGSTANMAHQEGIDLAALAPLLAALLIEIRNSPKDEGKSALTAKVQEVQTEAAKAKPDPKAIGTAVESIKNTAEVLGYGEKIALLCTKAYDVVAPCLGLPPSLLP
jgi:hypothetical protein